MKRVTGKNAQLLEYESYAAKEDPTITALIRFLLRIATTRPEAKVAPYPGSRISPGFGGSRNTWPGTI